MREPAELYDALRQRLAVRPLVLLLDVDGTLAPIAPTPDAAAVPEPVRQSVARLASASAVHVALVSGRAALDARRLVGVDGVWALGNHGFERIDPEGNASSDPDIAPWRDRVAAAAADAGQLVRQHEGALLENKTWTLSIHYRRAAPEAESALRTGLEAVAARHGLVLTGGKKVFEVRPPVNVNKGTASVALVRQLIADGEGAVLYAGDDRTDEDAFEALRAERPGAITIRIAPEANEAPAASAAEFVLADVDAMGAFLAQIAGQAAIRER